MVTLIIVYFDYIKIYVRYLLNILCPYYKFNKTILLDFLKLLQMTFIIIIILYIYINYM
jgi:hypothetical protein